MHLQTKLRERVWSRVREGKKKTLRNLQSEGGKEEDQADELLERLRAELKVKARNTNMS